MGGVELVLAKKEVVNRVNVNIAAVAEVVTFNTQITACEVTMPINIKTSEIMMPIDLQGSFIMMPMDIQAQYMNLAIDIVAQTIGNIKMDIAAQTIGNIGIDVKAQTLGELAIKAGDVAGNVNITIASTQKVELTTSRDWASKESQEGGVFANLQISGDSSGDVISSVILASTKDFYVTNVEVIRKDQAGLFWYEITGLRGMYYSIIGASQDGDEMDFSTPKVLVKNTGISVAVYNKTAEQSYFAVIVSGYYKS